MGKIQYKKARKTEYGAKQLYITMYNHPIAILNVDTGGGKTFMSIRAVDACASNAHIFVMTTKKQVDSKDWEASIESYNQVTGSQLTYTIINYEALRVKETQKIVSKQLQQHTNQPLYLIIDEAHKIKNPQTKSFKLAKKTTALPNFKKIICLTATPVSESLLDAMSYLILAGYYRNKTDFYKKHVVRYDNYFQPIVKDRSNRIHNEWLKDYEKIIDELKSIQVYIDTAELLPPVKNFEKVFEFDKATQKEYRQIKKDYINGVYDSISQAIQAQNEFVANHATQRDAYMTQLINNPKRPAGPVLVFYEYNNDLLQLRNYLGEHHSDYELKEINGSHKFDASVKPKDKTIFLCQYKAAGEALNASWSHLSIFFAPTYSWQAYKQARGRNVRAYQQGTTYHVRLVVRKTINEHYWYDLIDNKKAFTTDLMTNYLMK